MDKRFERYLEKKHKWSIDLKNVFCFNNKGELPTEIKITQNKQIYSVQLCQQHEK